MGKYLLILLVFLTGCASISEPTTIQNTKTVYKPLPSELTKQVKLPTPISREEYLKKDFVKKEIWLTIFNNQLQETVGVCNSQLKAISDLNESNIKNYSTP